MMDSLKFIGSLAFAYWNVWNLLDHYNFWREDLKGVKALPWPF
jgi:hypothetical protein